MFLACREQHARREKVDRRSDDRDCKPDANVGQGLRVNQPFDGGYADGTGRKQDQEAFETAGKVLGFAVAVGMPVVCGLFGNCQHGQRHHRAGEVDDGFQGVGQQTDRSGQFPRRRFQGDGAQGCENGEPGETFQ